MRQIPTVTALGFAADNNSTAAIEALLAAGADPNVQNSYGSTALLNVARSGSDQNNVVAIEALLDAGADANARIPFGQGCTRRLSL